MNTKQKKFVTAYLVDGDGPRAAVAAGYSPATAARLLALPAVRAAIRAETERRQAELERHRAAAQERAKVSLDSLLAEAEAARVVSKEAGAGSAMVAATVLKARLLGMLDAERRDHEADRAQRFGEQQIELKTAATLLSEAATSMGLPANASPAQIVGAVATRELATPAAYRLLRARVTDEP